MKHYITSWSPVATANEDSIFFYKCKASSQFYVTILVTGINEDLGYKTGYKLCGLRMEDKDQCGQLISTQI